MSYSLDSSTPTSKVIHINSADATTYLATYSQGGSDFDFTSYFRVFFEEGINAPIGTRMLVSLHSATIPYSFYNIRNEVNNEIYYKIDGLSTIHKLSIPEGSYTSSSLRNKVASLLLEVLSGGVVVGFDKTTQKFSFKVNTSHDSSRNFTFVFGQGAGYDANIELGFGANETKTITSTISYSTNVVDVNGTIHGLFIRTNITTDGSIDSKTKGLNTILGRIPIESNFGSILFFNPSNSSHKILIHNNTLNQFVIKLTDERNRLVNLNGLHFTIAIQVDFINYVAYTPPPENIRYIKVKKDIEREKEEKEYRAKKQKDKFRFG